MLLTLVQGTIVKIVCLMTKTVKRVEDELAFQVAALAPRHGRAQPGEVRSSIGSDRADLAVEEAVRPLLKTLRKVRKAQGPVVAIAENQATWRRLTTTCMR